MKILLTNDDGYGAPGIETLREVCEAFGHCIIVAPAGPQSGVGHAVTTDAPLRFTRHGDDRFAVEGTPADCARVGLCELVGEVDWVIAGINHGANLGSDTYVSGTVAAAREAAILGRRAIAISQYVGKHRRIDWQRSMERAAPVLRSLLDRGVPPGGFWNVNLPHPLDESTGCEAVECPVDPSPQGVRFERRAGALHWIGEYHERPRRPGHDIDVCFGGRVAVSPLRIAPER
ncbi:MAG: 5'/3'-nucleotidase SurE [Myxococcota bacterium]